MHLACRNTFNRGTNLGECGYLYGLDSAYFLMHGYWQIMKNIYRVCIRHVYVSLAKAHCHHVPGEAILSISIAIVYKYAAGCVTKVLKILKCV